MFRIIALILTISNLKPICLVLSPCDHNFTIDSYAITIDHSNASKSSEPIEVYEFMSHHNTYWLQNGLRKRQPMSLPFDRIDAAFFLNTFNCSNGGLELIAIRNSSFSKLSLNERIWTKIQSLKTHKLLNKILEPISENIRIDAITDWSPNRIIVFRDKTYRVYEWNFICEAIDGNGIKSHPYMNTKDWFFDSIVDASQLYSSGDKRTLLLMRKEFYRQMTIEDLNESNGVIKGTLGQLKRLNDMFVCFSKLKEDLWPEESHEWEAGLIEESERETSKGDSRDSLKSDQSSDQTFVATICAIVLLSLSFIVLAVIVPKDRYIIVREV